LLRSKLAILLPCVREGKIPLDKMQDAINDVQLSPFNPQNLVQWIDNKQTEFKELEASYMHLKHLQLINTAEEFQTLSSSTVFCFCLSFIQLDNSFLDLMFRHTYSQEKIDSYSSNDSSNNLFWYENNTLLDKLKTYSANFKEFSMENLNKSGVKFVLLPSDEILTKNEVELNASNSEFT